MANTDPQLVLGDGAKMQAWFDVSVNTSEGQMEEPAQGGRALNCVVFKNTVGPHFVDTSGNNIVLLGTVGPIFLWTTGAMLVLA